MSNQQHAEKLASQWQALYEGSGRAIDWVQEVRPNAPRLNNEADNLILKLLRTRNTARSLAKATLQPVTAGFFGLSQAGKSYLISALAAGENGKLETRFGGRQLDFIDHINPPGGGKEATGLVTRFTRKTAAVSNEYPVELRIFSEIDLAKILANSFLKDFNQEKVAYQANETQVGQLFSELSKRRQPDPVPGIAAEDMVSLLDYMQRHAEATSKRLALFYWPEAVKLAPHLLLEDRARLLSVLWGEVPEMTSAYTDFARALGNLGGAERVYAPLSVLVKQHGESLSQADSIMNVDMLERLNRNEDEPVQVCPYLNDELQAPVGLSLAVLAALTAELVFPLVEKTRVSLFENVDLLDFPGYRGRLNVESVAGISEVSSNPKANPLAQLILRGKVAYLFERYTDNQEMNVLVFCTASDKQSDVPNVDAVLTEWIRKTQGETPDIRSRRLSGLLWAMTRMDLRIQGSMQHNADLLQQAWDGMMKLTMIERFDQCSWLHEWGTNTPFNSTFLVRKPRTGAIFIEEKDGREVGIRPECAAQLEKMHETFIRDPSVEKFIDTPDKAWNAMLTIEDGGMRRMGDYLAQVALPELKLERIEEQLKELLRDLVDHRLGDLYQADNAGELGKKRRIANEVVQALSTRAVVFGNLLNMMQIPSDTLHSLYLQQHENDSDESDESTFAGSLADDPFGISDGFNLFDDADSLATSQTPIGSNYETRFAERVVSEWASLLRDIPEDQRKLDFFALPKEVLENLVDELITAANRLGLKDRIIKVISGTEQGGVRHEQLVERQIVRVRTLVSDFVSWLGFDVEPSNKRPDSRMNKGHKIFDLPPAMPPGTLPKLADQAIPFSRYFLTDWFVSFGKIAEENTGHSAGREITTDQNEKLGRILRHIRQAPMEESP